VFNGCVLLAHPKHWRKCRGTIRISCMQSNIQSVSKLSSDTLEKEMGKKRNTVVFMNRQS
jgi:hypothetical protein